MRRGVRPRPCSRTVVADPGSARRHRGGPVASRPMPGPAQRPSWGSSFPTGTHRTQLLPQTADVGAGGHLYVGGVDLVALAEEFGTPLFVYDEAHLRARCREAVAACGRRGRLRHQGVLVQAMARLGPRGGDVPRRVHGGRARTWPWRPGSRRTGWSSTATTSPRPSWPRPSRWGSAGSWSTRSTRSTAWSELTGPPACRPACPTCLVRVTPGVEAHTHEFVRTGQEDTKFGFSVGLGRRRRGGGPRSAAARRASSSACTPTSAARSSTSSRFARGGRDPRPASSAPLGLAELVVGGGLGVAYVNGESAPSIAEWAQAGA